MKGRIYDPTLGRFINPDPIIQAPGNTQSLNRYSYVMNNPLSLVDPTGYSSESFWKGLAGAVLVVAVIALVTYEGPLGQLVGWPLVTYGASLLDQAINGGYEVNVSTGYSTSTDWGDGGGNYNDSYGDNNNYNDDFSYQDVVGGDSPYPTDLSNFDVDFFVDPFDPMDMMANQDYGLTFTTVADYMSTDYSDYVLPHDDEMKSESESLSVVSTPEKRGVWWTVKSIYSGLTNTKWSEGIDKIKNDTIPRLANAPIRETISRAYNNAHPAAKWSMSVALTITEFGATKALPYPVSAAYDYYSGANLKLYLQAEEVYTLGLIPKWKNNAS